VDPERVVERGQAIGEVVTVEKVEHEPGAAGGGEYERDQHEDQLHQGDLERILGGRFEAHEHALNVIRRDRRGLGVS